MKKTEKDTNSASGKELSPNFSFREILIVLYQLLNTYLLCAYKAYTTE